MRSKILYLTFIFGALGIFGLFDKLYCQSFTNMAAEYGVSALPGDIQFGSGVSFYDINNDGLDDLSFTMANDSLRFYLNNGTGFELQPSYAYASGVVKHVLWVDYDNDGDLDFMVSYFNGPYKLYQNDGNFNFTDVSTVAGLPNVNERHYGISFGDYDRDGYLDFYICTYTFLEGPDPYHSLNHLYRNNGDGTFSDVTVAAGVGDGIRFSFQSVWFDYNNDGWPDLFIINDRIHPNSLYKNNGDGTFTDVSAIAGITYPGHDPMSATVGDFDNDGDLDLYFSNSGGALKLPKLLRNNGDETFTDVAVTQGVTVPHWAWGATWLDYDNDMLQDLFVATAALFTNITPVINYFFANTTSGNFANGNSIFLENAAVRSHSVARGDINNDGYADLVVLNQSPDDIFLWENSGGSNNFIKITLSGTVSNHFAVGSWIKVFVGGNQYTQYTLCGENYLGQNSQHHIFGLGQHEIIDSIKVTYISGHTDTYYDLDVNQNITFTEGETYYVEISADGPLNSCQGTTLIIDAGDHDNYMWSTGHNNQTETITASGIYEVTVTNEYGISASASVEVNFSPNPNILESISNITCEGLSNGTVLLQNLSMVPPDSVIWSNGMSGEIITDLNPGSLQYTYTDINGCTANGAVDVTEPQELQLETFTQPENQGNDATILIFVTGGTSPYAYFVNGAMSSTNQITGLASGTYFIEALDANECTISTTVNLLPVNTIGTLASKHFSVFPNPSKGTIYIETPQTFTDLEVKILTLDGRELSSDLYHNAQRISISTDHSAGMYFLIIRSEGIHERIKIILE